MGSTRWSDSHYEDRKKHLKATGGSAFAYNAAVNAGTAPKTTHAAMRPDAIKMRESRDSAAHPTSNAVAVFFDVTGSMSGVPRILQQNLPKLMGLLTRKNYLPDPQIMISAVGDATCDAAPLQIGQFESGNEIDDDLSKLYLEGGGGGQKTESYELGMYFLSEKTSIDCFEKRGKKGYAFFIGDEMPYDRVKKSEVEAVLGIKIQDDIPIETAVKRLMEKYEVFYILPNMTSHYNDSEVRRRWEGLLGAHRFLRLQDPEGINELIASTIGLCEGNINEDDVKTDLKDAGTTDTIISAVAGALVPVAASGNRKASGADIAVKDSGAGTGITTL